MARKNKILKDRKLQMRNDYLKYLATPIVHWDGKIRPPVRHPMKWERIESFSKSGVFVNLDSAILERKIWIWSDQHFNHENVIKYGKRPYSDSDDMNSKMIENYDHTVQEGDICIWAGDIFFKSKEIFNNEIMPFFDKTYNILVVGNHDFQGKEVKNMDFDEIHLLLDFDFNDKRFVVTHYPFDVENVDFVNVHGHIHQNESEHEHQINVSVEAINYHPVDLKELITK